MASTRMKRTEVPAVLVLILALPSSLQPTMTTTSHQQRQTQTIPQTRQVGDIRGLLQTYTIPINS